MGESGSIRRSVSSREGTPSPSAAAEPTTAERTPRKGAERSQERVATRERRLDSTGVGKPIPRSEAKGLEREKPLLRPTRSTGSRRNAPYIRQPKPRKTAEAIDDLGEDESYSAGFAHDSNIAVGGSLPLSGQPYRRSRADMGKLQRDLHYGQYLEIPKGRRQIFASRERERQIRSRIAAVVVIVVLLLATLLILRLGGALG
ncbi:MAG: hypothetical protein PUE38_06175 [Olsenella sp.]|uniref:Uncharacterized protein n=1 Tax=Olsenella absiana TaxID=3115222 RepID=A0ABU7R8Y7_9ACTN|nr:hypothetical protein [Olsenella sp.]